MYLTNSTKLLCVPNADKPYLSMHEIEFSKDNKEGKYWGVCRGKEHIPHDQKRPDAVLIIATVGDLLVMTHEYRPFVDSYVYGIPAGLIDPSDFSIGSVEDAVRSAAIREFKEETGLELSITNVFPQNIYASCGMTNESSALVFGVGNGEISKEFLESSEDINTLLMSKKELRDLLQQPSLAFSRDSFPFLVQYSMELI